MILSLVSELLARVGRQPVVEEALEALRRSGGEVRLSGLTDSAKALLVALAQAELAKFSRTKTARPTEKFQKTAPSRSGDSRAVKRTC